MKRRHSFYLILILCLTGCLNSTVKDNWTNIDFESISGTKNIYYVEAANGNDSNLGTVDQPFKTIGKAAGIVGPGDKVIVKQGVYNEIVEIKKSGTMNAWITFMANPGDRALVTINAGYWGGYSSAFHVTANYIHIEGFEITVPSQPYEGGSGIAVRGEENKPVHHIRIFNNTVHDCGGSGIGTGYADYLHIKGNIVYRNAFTSVWQESGINLWEGRAFDNKKGFHNIVENNISFDNENKQPPVYQDGTLVFDYTETSDGNGIIIDWCRDENSSTLVQNNICFNNGGRGIQVTASVNVTVRNNTVYMNSKDKNSEGELGNHYTTQNNRDTGGRNIVFQNNIAYARRGEICLSAWDKPGCVYDYNLYFNETAVNSFGTTTANGRNPQNHGSHNIVNQNPLFTRVVFVPVTGMSNSADYNFRLRASSPAIDAGNESLTAAADFYGTLRSKADLGAIAFAELMF